MLRVYKADLHIHTCLSPCTELDMSPSRIIAKAKEKDINVIGVCDHNSSENSIAVMKAAENTDINVFPGMEVTSQEEVHILALFDEIKDALNLQEYVYQNLPGENDEGAFGMQVIVNEKDEVLGFNNKLLIGATTIPLAEVIQIIHSFNGIAIASHIDREAFSLISQLGFIPENLELDALEISPRMTYEEVNKNYKNSYPITCSSDAHYPHDIGKGFTSFLLEDSTIEEIKKALKNEDGRKLIH
ncbi:MAG: PHP domain-containing protein [Candidatus Aminicenantes bacterium]|nr:PHP domain-containing protein [Candidatus Aminicenantes bacterium]MDH5706305.1 PHP domain-containing protein [Candidatus Aminicenantes bacterium]